MSRLCPVFWFCLLFFVFFRCPAQQDTLLKKEKTPVSLSDFHYGDLVLENGAAGVFLTSHQLHISFENRFCIKSLMLEEVGAVFRYRQNAFAAEASHFGDHRYGKVSVAFGYARGFGKHLSVGLKFYYYLEHAQEMPALHSISFDLSLYAALGKNMGLGFAVLNPAGLRYGIVGKQKLPVRFNLFWDYRIGKNILLTAQLEKELQSRLMIFVGAKYRIRCLCLSLKIGCPKPRMSVSIMLAYRQFLLGVSGEYHLPLGFVPKAQIFWRFGSAAF